MKYHEELEQRQLLSVSLANGTLTITGTGKANSITAQQDSTSLIVSDDGVVTTFAIKKVKQLSVSLNGGDDFFAMQKKGGTRIVRLPATINGGSGNDLLRGGARNDLLNGSAGNDTLDGGTGADFLDGGIGTDTADYSLRVNAVFVELDNVANDGETNEDDNVGADIERVIGGAGDDTFKAAPADLGTEEVFGGAGTDVVDYSAISAADGNGIVPISLDDLANDGTRHADNIHSDVENVIGSPFSDSITGSDAPNSLIGNAGDDSLLGEGGDDFLSGGIGRDFVDGGAGVDTDSIIDPPNGNIQDIDTVGAGAIDGGDIIASDPFDKLPPEDIIFDQINGTAGNDVIIVTQNGSKVNIEVNGMVQTKTDEIAILIECGGGNDVVALSKSDGTKAFQGFAAIEGAGGNDTLRGGAGNDTIDGGSGNDQLSGADGNDSLMGEGGDDTLNGNAGNDALIGGGGADDMSGGPGNDTADYSSSSANLLVTMDDDLANDGAAGEKDNVHSDIENLFAGSGDDQIVGNAAANFLSGGAGNDYLRGGKGLDKLVGGAGKDTLLGNGDIDLLLLSDGAADDFDTALDSAGHPLIDFISGDVGKDFSVTSKTVLD